MDCGPLLNKMSPERKLDVWKALSWTRIERLSRGIWERCLQVLLEMKANAGQKQIANSAGKVFVSFSSCNRELTVKAPLSVNVGNHLSASILRHRSYRMCGKQIITTFTGLLERETP